jgi:SsrA-binding protein
VAANSKKGSKPAGHRKRAAQAERVVAQNRAASYHYHLLEKFEAGLVLTGTEVKSLRDGKATLRDAYGEVRGGELWLQNCHIPPYPAGGPFNHEPLRRRKLLLHRQEIDKLRDRVEQKGMTLIPLRLYFRDGVAKCEIALARGKKIYDRRRSEREREAEREAKEAIYRYRRR